MLAILKVPLMVTRDFSRSAQWFCIPQLVRRHCGVRRRAADQARPGDLRPAVDEIRHRTLTRGLYWRFAPQRFRRWEALGFARCDSSALVNCGRTWSLSAYPST